MARVLRQVSLGYRLGYRILYPRQTCTRGTGIVGVNICLYYMITLLHHLSSFVYHMFLFVCLSSTLGHVRHGPLNFYLFLQELVRSQLEESLTGIQEGLTMLLVAVVSV